MKIWLIRFATFLSATLMFASCFPALTDDDEIGAEGLHQLAIHVASFDQVPFSRAIGSVGVARLDLAIFDEDDNRLVRVNQQSTDADFLHPTVSVPEGELKLVIIAHSGAGAATLTSPTEVTFPKNKVTDTFSLYRTLTITPDSPTSLTLHLSRAVAMVRVILTDAILPADFSQLQLYYTGGSSTFSPTTGFGAKNSRQTEVRSEAEAVTDADGHRHFEVYTFPHIVEDELKLTLTPQDASGQSIAPPVVLEDVPVRLNYITECRGLLFSSGVNASGSFHITIDSQWSDVLHYDF